MMSLTIKLKAPQLKTQNTNTKTCKLVNLLKEGVFLKSRGPKRTKLTTSKEAYLARSLVV